MKQILVLTAAVIGVLGATEARAQDRGGVRFGYNAATTATDEDGVDPKTRSGFVVGFFGVVPVNAMFAVQPEFVYSQQGAKVEDGSDKATLKIDYIHIPVLARIRLGAGSPAHLLVGPSFGFRTRAESEFGGADDGLQRRGRGERCRDRHRRGRQRRDVRRGRPLHVGLTNIDKSDRTRRRTACSPCRPGSGSRSLQPLDARADVGLDEVDDLLHGASGEKDAPDPHGLQLRDVDVRNDAADNDEHVVEPLLFQ